MFANGCHPQIYGTGIVDIAIATFIIRIDQTSARTTRMHAPILVAPMLQAYWQQHQGFAGLLSANPAARRLQA
eukprot:11208442-Lingulodinium_polyedra.AAC.1